MGRTLLAIAMAGALLLTASSTSASTASATQRKRHRKPPVKAAPPPAPDPIPIPLPPPPPAYPVHDPAVPPEVSYVNGQLLINAKNSTLSDVLKAVEKDTGATFDISSGDTSERVVGRIGPGTPRDVMAELLNGSHFNYVMLSPIGNPSALSKVLLTPRSKGSAGQTYTAQQQPPQTFQQPMQISPGLPIQQQVQQQNAAAEESSDNGDAAADENADNQNQDQPENQPETQDPAQSVQAPQQPPGVKTPEQLLQELRQQQQQVIQQQQIPQGAQPQPDDNR